MTESCDTFHDLFSEVISYHFCCFCVRKGIPKEISALPFEANVKECVDIF